MNEQHKRSAGQEARGHVILEFFEVSSDYNPWKLLAKEFTPRAFFVCFWNYEQSDGSEWNVAHESFQNSAGDPRLAGSLFEEQARCLSIYRELDCFLLISVQLVEERT